jgi:glycosyltransferase involved in cell wall biosynthesis
VRLLFVAPTGAWSGAETVLLSLLQRLETDHELAVACPRAGRLADELDRAGVRRFAIPAVELSFRLDPIRTTRGVANLGAAVAVLARTAARFGPDVIHANAVRAGLVCALAKRHGGPALVVHVHEHLPTSWLGNAVRGLIARSADEVVAVSGYAAAQFDSGLARPVARRVHNGIDLTRFDPERVQPAPLRSELEIGEQPALLGVVAQITPWKGQDTAIRALAQIRRGGLDAHLAIVGEVVFAGPHVRHDNPAFLRRLHRLASELGVSDAVHFTGYRSDVPEVLAALDLVLAPSWDEPFALTTIESMAMGTPVFAGSIGGGAELVEDGVSGRVLAPFQPDAWGAAASELLRDRAALGQLGVRARQAASSFSAQRQADEMLAVYERAARAARSTRSHRARR